MAAEIFIKCKSYGGSLFFSQKNKEGWTTGIIGNGVTAKIVISDYIDTPCLFFSELASNWQGWDGVKTYQTLEGELIIHAWHDKMREVSLQVILTPNDSKHDWKLEHTFVVDPGELDRISEDVRCFFLVL